MMGLAGLLGWRCSTVRVEPVDNGAICCHPRRVPLVDLVLGRPPRTPHADAVADLDTGVTIYWRDGCPYCMRLRHAVRKHADRATWVDIWADPEAAAYVRSTNEAGHEVVPTVVVDGVVHTNPKPSLIKKALASS